MQYGKSIELFLVNGTANSLVTAELSNWSGKAIKIPRDEITDCDRSDLKQAGVYFLFCKEEDKLDSVYIGEAENVKDRLQQHMRDYQNGKEPYFWETCLIFVGRDLNKTLVRYLEDRLVSIAKECGQYSVITKNTYKHTVIKESQIATMEEFIENIKILTNTLGFKVLEQKKENIKRTKIPEEVKKCGVQLYLNRKVKDIGKITAYGVKTNDGFIVKKGSKISPKYTDLISKNLLKIKESASIEDDILQEDLWFKSASTAANFCTGQNCNGLKEWKNENGIPLKEL